MGVSMRYSLHVVYFTKYKFIHMCIQTKCQCYFSKNMGAKARGQWNNFQLLSDRQWKWSSLASRKYWHIGQDLDANKEIQYTGLISINKHVSIWLCVCMCLYHVFFPVNGCCISTNMHVSACEDTGSEIVQKCLAAQAKFGVDNQNKRFLPWQEIRPT